MRISTTFMFQQQTKSISQTQVDWLAVGERLSSGKRVVYPSDDPIATSQALSIQQNQRTQQRFGMAQQFAQTTMGAEAAVFSSLTDNIHAAISDVIYGATGTLNDEDRQSVAVKLEGVRNQLLTLANTQDSSGRYLFAGYNTAQPPFIKENGGVVYQGGEQPIVQQVDTQRVMTLSHTGKQVFLSAPPNPKLEPDGTLGDTDLFSVLDNAIAALKTPMADADDSTRAALQEAMNSANRGLNNSLNNILALQSENGTQLAELASLNTLSASQNLIAESQLSQLVDADITQTISEYYMKQTALQASYTAFTQMSKLSLFQLNK
ncbi:flagellar hook-associated protein FlgL [Rosenbergiella australiborealis]|uniref:Flagellar hook-associated protein FlgL n=1 Tax=Rosenbergiella australiborealis TaxID=1544696 RepID=A0ABS5T2R1_9GAMM|nr:flagellar hook-associated protein FlgL [Rosenbergiella australiborealis]MBT0726625.1 flagellar hook-associated protein FlgL [Rosenbergiella australiborealis]